MGRVAPSCQVCGSCLASSKAYYRKARICVKDTLKAEVLRQGLPHRFCQQCARLHELSEFDGCLHSCRKQLARRAERRRERRRARKAQAGSQEEAAEEGSTAALWDGSPASKRQRSMDLPLLARVPEEHGDPAAAAVAAQQPEASQVEAEAWAEPMVALPALPAPGPGPASAPTSLFNGAGTATDSGDSSVSQHPWPQPSSGSGSGSGSDRLGSAVAELPPPEDLSLLALASAAAEEWEELRQQHRQQELQLQVQQCLLQQHRVNQQLQVEVQELLLGMVLMLHAPGGAAPGSIAPAQSNLQLPGQQQLLQLCQAWLSPIPGPTVAAAQPVPPPLPAQHPHPVQQLGLKQMQQILSLLGRRPLDQL